ncbi:MAG: accessory Sec system protein Asp2 [Clostridiales bacterium]|nr:accessory Sec system protein Asp2 [Clostridiales bacterium]
MEVLQTGNVSWAARFEIPAQIRWTFRDVSQERLPEDILPFFDAVILEGRIPETVAEQIRRLARPYTFFYTDATVLSAPVRRLLVDKRAGHLKQADIPDFLKMLPQQYYHEQEGSKLPVRQLKAVHPFDRILSYDGNRAAVFDMDFGDEYRQLMFAGYNIPVNLHENRGIEIWPEFSVGDQVRIQYRFRFFLQGSTDEAVWSGIVEGDTYRKPLVLRTARKGYMSVQIFVKGRGRAEIGPIHHRSSRLGAGQFLPGGQRAAASDRGEVIHYFDPGDCRPPLMVYFSGYRTAEGFEGNMMMRSFGTPFLLLADPRLEGGAFYLGEKDYEERIAAIIDSTLETLGFSPDQMIMTGLSMGAFGALYYSCRFHPHAVVLGKPLINLGQVAANERRLRPGGFPTSLDVLRMAEGGLEPEHVQRLNDRIWRRFDTADFRDTVFAVAYMKQDDYDGSAYEDMLRHLEGRQITVVGKGLDGRHNDNTSGIVSWFMSQLTRILRQDFKREVTKNG